MINYEKLYLNAYRQYCQTVQPTRLMSVVWLILGMLVAHEASSQVQLIEESTITSEGLYFWYADGSKAYHYNPNISPRGDCFTVSNGYIFFGWYKGGMTNRDLMISRKKIGSGSWVTVQLPHKNTLIQPGNLWGDSHRTISVGVSALDSTVHIFYDHHNDPLKYIVSKKGVAYGSDSQFTLSNFEPTRGYLAEGQPVTITYPKITQNDRGEIILNYRKGSAVGGNEMVHVYNGDTWTRSKQVTRGAGLPYVAVEDRNYAYGTPYFNNGEVYYAFSVRWAAKKDLNILNEGVYLAKCGPTMTDPWEDPNGVKHTLPIQDYSPFLIEDPASNNGKGSSGGPGLVVSENGDVHITYNGRGSDTYKYTYSRRVGEAGFTRHDGTLKTGLSWNNRFYTVNASSSGVITVSSGEPGSVNYVTELVVDTEKSLGVTSSYLNDGKLVLIVSESKASDKKDIYCYVFQLPGGQTNQPPSVSITQPSNNSSFLPGTAVTLAADAFDDGSIAKVNFRINGTFFKQDQTAPYSATWIPTTAGTYTVDAVAYDDQDVHTESSSVVVHIGTNAPPLVSFSSPAGDATEQEGYSSFYVDVNATDPDGAINNVELFIDGTFIRRESVAPYEWGHAGFEAETTGLTVGAHTFKAVATDNEGLTSESSFLFTVAAIPVTIESVQAEQAPNVATNLLDGDISDESRWSAQVFPKSVVFDLGLSKSITGTNMWTYSNRAYQYQVETSDSPNSGFVLRADQTSNTSSSQPLSTSFSTQARYVRLTVTGAYNYSNDWVSINEFEILTGNQQAREGDYVASTTLAHAMRIHPNPSSDAFTIQWGEGQAANVVIYNVHGALVYKQEAVKSLIRLSKDSGFKTGLYIVQLVFDDSSSLRQKLILD